MVFIASRYEITIKHHAFALDDYYILKSTECTIYYFDVEF